MGELCPFCPASYSTSEDVVKHAKEKHPILFGQQREGAALMRLKTRAFAEKITVIPKKIVIPAEYAGVVVAVD